MITSERARITISMDGELKKRAEEEAKRLGISFSGFVSVAIAEKFKQEEVLGMTEMLGKLMSMAETAQLNNMAKLTSNEQS